MMYNNKLAVAIKSNGKVLREFKDEVYVPFGTEYSLFVKNLNSVRALVSVSIDGVDVGDGTSFVVNANDTIDIERFIKNGNLNEGNRLKFIERTQNIENHRGVCIEDGIIRVEFNFEKVYQPTVFYNHTIFPDIIGSGPLYGSSDARGVVRNATFTTSVAGSASSGNIKSSNNLSIGDQNQAEYSADVFTCDSYVPDNDAGVTVAGSHSDQQFKQANWFATEAETHVMVLRILGETKDNVQVTKPVTVRAKPRCTTCGRVNKATAKFCTECGTSLHIV